MDLSAPHAGFVIAAYMLTAAGLLVLVSATLMRDRRLAREAADLEVRKRSGEEQ